MSMVVRELMMVTDPALDLMCRSSPWREEGRKEAQRKKRRRREQQKDHHNQNIGVREDEKKKNKQPCILF